MSFPDRIQQMAQLLGSDGSASSEDMLREYTVEELALAGNTTVRNIRAYQDKGLLAPPALRGRKGIYNNHHLSRLQLIASLLDRGYTLSSIRDLLQAASRGIGLDEVLGIQTALSSPWGDEKPVNVKLDELLERFGDHLTPESIATARDMGFMTIEGDNVRISSMRLLEVVEELTATGIPLQDLLNIQVMMRDNVQTLADEFVKLVADHVLGQYGGQNLPPPEELPKIAQLVWRLRPLAQKAVDAVLADAMSKAANEFLTDKLEEIVGQIDSNKGA